MRKGYAEEVAEKIIEQLEQGTAPWQIPWQPGELKLPYNAVTEKEYRGINSMYLHMQGHSDPRWMTYKQAAGEDAQVRKGEKGTHIVYWKFHDEKKKTDEQGRPVIDPETGKQETYTVKLERPRSFMAVVFNASQIDGLPPLEQKPANPEPERIARAENILVNSGAKINHENGNRAFYSLTTDSITLPERNQFAAADDYYATALHELGHWTGHPKRLDRDLAHPFGSEGYAKEELRAEIASLMLGERLDIGHDPGQHAAYVGSWVKALKEDPKEIFRAATAAEHITSYVMEFEKEQEQIKAVDQEQAQSQPINIIRANKIELSQEAGQAEHAVLHTKPEKPMQGRTYLAVPYSEKDEAKSLGAKWDKTAKSWYAPEGVSTTETGLEKWSVEKTNVITAAAAKPAPEQFIEALKEAGLNLDGPLEMDGKLHRVEADGDKKGQTSGAYAYHETGQTPGGYIQNYKTGEIVHWKPEGKTVELSAAERAQMVAQAAEHKQTRDAERLKVQTETAQAAQILWDESPAATPDNAYCKLKGISNPAGLREVPATVSPKAAEQGIRIAQTAKEAKELREADPKNRVFKVGDLLIPGADTDGKLWTLQTVNPYFKSFMKGGKKEGLFTIAGTNPDGKAVAELLPDEKTPLVLAEGYATADTVADLSKQPVIVAFDSGNLNAVAQNLREKFPERTMLIAADNDHNAPNELGANGKPKVNVGLEKAIEVAAKHGAGIAAPKFEKGEKASDWNDLRESRGDESARKMLAEQMAAAKRDAAIITERITTLARTRELEARNDPTTSADDAEVAAERGKAASMIVAASEQNSQVRSATADNSIKQKNTRPAVAAKSSLDRKTETLRDTAKRERQDVLSPSKAPEKETKNKAQEVNKQRSRARSQGMDGGM